VKTIEHTVNSKKIAPLVCISEGSIVPIRSDCFVLHIVAVLPERTGNGCAVSGVIGVRQLMLRHD
jgi:hypothetical protein